jgi:hypothetical protein
MPAHTSLPLQQLLTSTKMTFIPRLAYSPELASWDFFLFLKTKLKLKGRCTESIEETQAESQYLMQMLTQSDFQ